METKRATDRASGFDDRRVDLVTADIVHVGIVYMGVFGRLMAPSYFVNTDVAPHVYWRLVLGAPRDADLGDRAQLP
jgi:hypothetical protein